MDVTSLLNGEARRGSASSSTPSATGETTATTTAVPTPEPEQPERVCLQKASGSPSPRRPWTGEGFSLPPRVADHKSIPSSGTHTQLVNTNNTGTTIHNNPLHNNARPHNSHSPEIGRNFSGSPKSPCHKFSDSRSSVNSFSSCSSYPHSRISSLSTISDSDNKHEAQYEHFHRPGATMDESTPNRSGSPSDFVIHSRHGIGRQDGIPSCAEWHANFPQNVAEERAAAHRRAVSAPGHAQIHAPVSGPIIATNTEHYSSGVADPERHAYRESLGDPERHFHPDEVADLERLERHVQLDSLGEAANNVENDDADTKPDPNVHLYKPLHPMYVVDYFLPEDYHYMFPNTAQDMRDQMQLLINLIPKYEWRITELKQLQNSDCEYMVPCNLDTKLRKAISHLFGRNKLQTRSVPEVVWIYWCRKHYQRVKYRLGTRFAVKQMDLVKKTLWRIWLWSQLEQGGPDMVKNNPSPRVLSWKLITRKREKEKQNTNKRKADSMEEGAEDENPSREDDNANHDPTSAVTGWLLEKCDQTYSTVQMLEILRRVELELQDETRSKMPEIEILPNFPDGTGGRPVSKPKSQRRKSSAAQLSIAQLSAGQLNAGQLNAAQLNVAQPGTVQLNGGHQRAQSMGFPYATTARYAATNDQGGHVRRTSHPANSFVPSVSPPPAFAMPPPTPYNTPQLYQNGYAPTPTPSYLQAPARLDFSFASPAPQSAMAGPLTASFNMPPMQNHQRRASQPGGYSYGQSTSPELGSQHTDKRQCVEEGTSGIHGVTRRNEQRTVPVMQPGPSQYSYGYITQSQSFTNQPSYGQQPVSGYQQSYGQQPVGAQQQSYGRQSAGGLQQPYAQQPTGGQAAGMPRNYSYNYQRLPTPSLSRGNGGYGAAPAGGTKHMRHHSSHC